MTYTSSHLATSLKALAALVIMAGLPVYAHAEDTTGPKVRVSTTDLDLTTSQGQATARVRVERAAAHICADLVPAGEGMLTRDGCTADVAAAAMPQLEQQFAQAESRSQIRLAADEPATTQRLALAR